MSVVGPNTKKTINGHLVWMLELYVLAHGGVKKKTLTHTLAPQAKV